MYKVRREGIKTVKQRLISIAAAKKNILKEKDVMKNLKSSKTEYHHNNNIDSTKDNQDSP